MLSILGIKMIYPVLTPELENIYEQYLDLKEAKRFDESDKLRQILIDNKII